MRRAVQISLPVANRPISLQNWKTIRDWNCLGNQPLWPNFVDWLSVETNKLDWRTSKRRSVFSNKTDWSFWIINKSMRFVRQTIESIGTCHNRQDRRPGRRRSRGSFSVDDFSLPSERSIVRKVNSRNVKTGRLFFLRNQISVAPGTKRLYKLIPTRRLRFCNFDDWRKRCLLPQT